MAIAEKILQLKEDFENVRLAGVAEGFQNGELSGSEAERMKFWNGFFRIGSTGTPTRTSFKYAFYQWNHSVIDLPYDIKPTSLVDSMFESCNNLQKIPLNIDFSNFVPKTTASSGGWLSTFSSCASITEFPDLKMQAGGYNNTWRHCGKLKKIEVMRCCEEGIYANPFSYCSSLTDITIEGVIGNSFPIPDSPLSPTSLKNIIFHLKNYNGDATKEHKNTVAFKTSAFDALESEGFTEEDKLWLAEKGIEYYDDLTWALVIDDLKWNLTLA